MVRVAGEAAYSTKSTVLTAHVAREFVRASELIAFCHDLWCVLTFNLIIDKLEEKINVAGIIEGGRWTFENVVANVIIILAPVKQRTDK